MTDINESRQYELFRLLANKIIKLKHKLPKVESVYFEIIKRKNLFLMDVKKEHVYFAILCVLALIFDFFLSKVTMRPLARISRLRPEIIALIFNFMDAIVAILASGVLVRDFKDLIAIRTQKRIWLSILWAFCSIKIVLFLFTAISQGIKPISTILIIFLVLLVYSILHFGGSGLYYLFNTIKFGFLETWHDNPEKIKHELKKKNQKFSQEVQKHGFDEDKVRKYFGIEKETT